MTNEELLGEVEDILRSKPDLSYSPTEEHIAWYGRAAAFVDTWNLQKSILVQQAMGQIYSSSSMASAAGLSTILTLLHQARHDLRMKTIGPVNVAMGQGRVFDYFDEVRKIIEDAKGDLLFVDPYLDAEFVSRYLPHVSTGVVVRLLARERLSTLLPAVDMYCEQHGCAIQVRSSPGFHDRYVIVDGALCYHSGASFKDGAKRAPTTLTQITDAFPAVRQTYEDLWNKATVER